MSQIFRDSTQSQVSLLASSCRTSNRIVISKVLLHLTKDDSSISTSSQHDTASCNSTIESSKLKSGQASEGTCRNITLKLVLEGNIRQNSLVASLTDSRLASCTIRLNNQRCEASTYQSVGSNVSNCSRQSQSREGSVAIESISSNQSDSIDIAQSSQLCTLCESST